MSPGGQSSAWRGTKVLGSTISLAHPPAKIPKGTSSHHELACTVQTPNAGLLWIHPSDGSASLPVLQGPSQSRPPKAKGAEPTPPDPMHFTDPPWLLRQIPLNQHHKPGSVQVAQTGATPLHAETCPWERGREGTHQSGCGPSGGLGADNRLNCSPAHQHKLLQTAQGKSPAVLCHSRDYKNDETEEFSSKETPGSSYS